MGFRRSHLPAQRVGRHQSHDGQFREVQRHPLLYPTGVPSAARSPVSGSRAIAVPVLSAEPAVDVVVSAWVTGRRCFPHRNRTWRRTETRTRPAPIRAPRRHRIPVEGRRSTGRPVLPLRQRASWETCCRLPLLLTSCEVWWKGAEEKSRSAVNAWVTCAAEP